MKRVAAAVGEGSMAIAFVQQYLREHCVNLIGLPVDEHACDGAECTGRAFRDVR